MVKCPACFNTLVPERHAWLCTSGQCQPEPDAAASRHAGFAVGMATVTEWRKAAEAGRRWSPPVGIPCRKCGVTTVTAVCPDCHYGPMLDDWRASETTCIAMAGAHNTGKSFYVAIAVKQLDMLASKLNTGVTTATPRTRATYHQFYEKPLYESRSIIPPTARVNTEHAYQREPLIFSLGVLKNKRRYIVIRDVAGEDLEADVVDTDHLSFISRADGVFFLFDPLNVREVREQLEGVISLPDDTGGDPMIVLDNVLSLIGQKSPCLAILLSKFDTLQGLHDGADTVLSRVMANRGAAMMRDPSLNRPSWDEADAARMHEEIRSMLLLLRGKDFVLRIERPQRGFAFDHKYFGVSVLGAAPTGDQLHEHGIAPFRCLDPIKWVLHRTGAL